MATIEVETTQYRDRLPIDEPFCHECKELFVAGKPIYWWNYYDDTFDSLACLGKWYDRREANE